MQRTPAKNDELLETADAIRERLRELGLLDPQDPGPAPRPTTEFEPIPYTGEDPSKLVIRLRGER